MMSTIQASAASIGVAVQTKEIVNTCLASALVSNRLRTSARVARCHPVGAAALAAAHVLSVGSYCQVVPIPVAGVDAVAVQDVGPDGAGAVVAAVWVEVAAAVWVEVAAAVWVEVAAAVWVEVAALVPVDVPVPPLAGLL
jgi:hypothetical protein